MRNGSSGTSSKFSNCSLFVIALWFRLRDGEPAFDPR